MDMILLWDNNFGADIQASDSDILLSDDLRTAVLISWFTDMRAPDSADVEGGDPGGWWGDTFPDVEGFEIGSLLWLLNRAGQTQDTLNKAQDYATQALQWMLDDGVATAINVVASYDEPGQLWLHADITTVTAQEWDIDASINGTTGEIRCTCTYTPPIYPPRVVIPGGLMGEIRCDCGSPIVLPALSINSASVTLT